MTYIDEVAAAIRSKLDPALLPAADVDRLFRIYAVLALAKGTDVTPRDIHDAWAAWECDRGPVSSPSLVPFEDLPPAVRRLDEPFVRAVHEVARERLPAGS